MTDRQHGIFECPDCGHGISLTLEDGLDDAVLLCHCNQNFPSMDLLRGSTKPVNTE